MPEPCALETSGEEDEKPGMPSQRLESNTRKILISDPDEGQLGRDLAGRKLTPDLEQFLKRLIKSRKGTRKINIPSTHDDLAAGLVFASELKEGGLEIFSELHVFFEGQVRVEKWLVLGEREQTGVVPTEMFRSAEVHQVRVKGQEVHVSLQLTVSEEVNKAVVRIFDFLEDDPEVRIVENPFA